jgi:hypothetical protein
VVSGANSVTIVSRNSNLSAIRESIDEVSKGLDVRVYDVEKASTLEEAYREAMRDG